ncbi:hypothetical protein WA158_004061 [Blastocystis sp. Blastoise]
MLSYNRKRQLLCLLGVAMIFCVYYKTANVQTLKRTLITMDEPFQNGILPEGDPFAYFGIFDVKYDILDHERTVYLINAIKKFRDVLILYSRDHDTQITGTISFGKKMWKQLIDGKTELLSSAPELINFPGYGKSPATQTDIYIHIHSAKLDANLDAARKIVSLLNGSDDLLTLVDEQFGFSYKNGRDLTGFIDGTMNPHGHDERKKAAITKDFSSYVFVQRYVHRLKKWEKLDIDQQEQVIGRTKNDSTELSPLPMKAHISRADVSENGNQLQIVRQSMPYASVSGEKGLWFTAYASSLHNHDSILKSMNGLAEDQIVDSILTYIKPVTGAYFFVPSYDMIDKL